MRSRKSYEKKSASPAAFLLFLRMFRDFHTYLSSLLLLAELTGIEPVNSGEPRLLRQTLGETASIASRAPGHDRAVEFQD